MTGAAFARRLLSYETDGRVSEQRWGVSRCIVVEIKLRDLAGINTIARAQNFSTLVREKTERERKRVRNPRIQ